MEAPEALRFLCATCGAEARKIKHDRADGECPNCGLVGWDVDVKDGEPFECLSREAFLDRQARAAELAANPPVESSEDVPF